MHDGEDVHRYQDLHRLVDRLRPEQADALRAVVLQLVAVVPGPPENAPADGGDGSDPADAQAPHRYRRLSITGIFAAEPDLAERSEEMFRRDAE
jgi:hypothetical protein